jgi:hypothetical protein
MHVSTQVMLNQRVFADNITGNAGKAVNINLARSDRVVVVGGKGLVEHKVKLRTIPLRKVQALQMVERAQV